MTLGTFLIRNGRVTGGLPSSKCLVKSKKIHALSASWFWSVSENNQNNSWNLNFGNGQFNNNNNNKNNANVVRAVAALDNNYVAGWFDAFDDCCKHKKMSSQCVMYRLSWHLDLLNLAYEVQNRTYRPTTSICFIVTRPQLREIFAAHFRDRIVQHWLCLRLEPLFEQRFIEQGNVSFNCRKGFGTLACVNRIVKGVEQLSENYIKEAWYGKFDIQGFFMSIDCEVLLKYLLPFIKEKWSYWNGTPYEHDLDLVLWLIEVVIRHRPQNDCIRRGNVKLWTKLPRKKSMFFAKFLKGIAMGNVTSQELANFLMSIFDEWAIEEAGKLEALYLRFVDDFTFICKTKKDAIYLRQRSREKLRTLLKLKMHPNKIYIQEVKKGVKIVGSVVKPFRTYLANRTVDGFLTSLKELEELCNVRHDGPTTIEEGLAIERKVKSINSYMGFLIHHKTYAIRRNAFDSLTHFWRYCYLKGNYRIVKLKKNVILC